VSGLREGFLFFPFFFFGSSAFALAFEFLCILNVQDKEDPFSIGIELEVILFKALLLICQRSATGDSI
jgi:hypothetical protein